MADRTIENPVTGERARFIETSAETGGRRSIGEVEVTRTRPATRIIAVPSGAKLFTLEAAITGTLPQGRGLKITGQWLREVPPGTPPDSVVTERSANDTASRFPMSDILKVPSK